MSTREPHQARGRFIYGGSHEFDAMLGEVYDKGPGSFDHDELAKIWAASACTMFPTLAQIRDAARIAVAAAPASYGAEALELLANIARMAGDALPVPTIGDENGTAPPAPFFAEAGWRPRETAPRDGETVLVALCPVNGRRVTPAAYVGGKWLLLDQHTPSDPSTMPADGEYAPTHWMPLPTPPAAVEGGQ